MKAIESQAPAGRAVAWVCKPRDARTSTWGGRRGVLLLVVALLAPVVGLLVIERRYEDTVWRTIQDKPGAASLSARNDGDVWSALQRYSSRPLPAMKATWGPVEEGPPSPPAPPPPVRAEGSAFSPAHAQAD
jgi:hypothetical protein